MERGLRTAVVALCMATIPSTAVAQSEAEARLQAGTEVTEIRFAPDTLTLEVDERVPMPELRMLDADGREVDAMVRVFARGVLEQDDGELTAARAGEGELLAVVMTPPDYDGERVVGRLPAIVTWPPVTRVEVRPAGEALFVGTAVRHEARALHDDGSERPDASFRWSSSDPAVVSVDAYGHAIGEAAGRAVVTASFAGVEGSVEHRVEPYPARSLDIDISRVRGVAADSLPADLRTGDVLTFDGIARTGAGETVDVPITWSFTYVPADGVEAPGAAGEVRNGKFVAEAPGLFTVLATSGPLTARRSFRVESRDVIRPIRVLGQGAVTHVHTSDIWPFEGVDGRDYAVTGTWGGSGWAYFWDITDPSAIEKVDSVQVDARTVNDVKVSPDGRYAALSREGASSRRNGVVIIDLSNPRDPEVASVYDRGLTGGVHNMFATDDHLFALSGGDKYVILDVTDLTDPTYVSEYNHPDSRIHDVWVHDGLAYSSEWGRGVVVVDVGDGRWGGSIEDPTLVTTFPTPGGATHAALPYHQEETGKTYLLLGDEILSRPGRAWAGTGVRIPAPGTAPASTAGYLHVLDFTDPEDPEYVARYEAEEYGTHNLWVEDDVLYQAYYEGGMRIVDVSGELLGDLKAQDREIAVFKPFDPDGYVANAPMVWGGFTHDGTLFLSDFNSGVWAVRLEPGTGADR